MKTTQQRPRFSRTLIALAVLAAIGQVQAQEASVSSSVSVGGLYVNGDPQDRARFSLYNGLREDNGYGLFDFMYGNKDSASGLWTTFEGRNIFLDTREANFTTRKLGDWKVSADYSEIIRNSPYTINTADQGLGTTTPTVVRLATPGTGQEMMLETKRKGITLAGSTWLGGAMQFEASFKSEDKEGSRIFGRGFACSATWVSAGTCAATATQAQWALLFLPEPVDSTINQLDAKFTYAKDALLLTAGYYANLYINRNSNLTPTIPGSLNNPLGVDRALDAGLRTTLALPMALPPDSESQQLYVLGNYRFTPTTVANFKYAYTKATQKEDFGGMGFYSAPSGLSNLGGEVNSTLLQAGLSARPLPKLTVVANVRFDEREDKTPVAPYNIEGGPTTIFTNSPGGTKKKSNAKLEGSYLLPGAYRATVGLDWEAVDHGEFTPTSSVAGLSGLRQKTKEDGYRLELRKSVSETVTGFVSYAYTNREGDSSWLKPLTLAQGRGVIEANDDPACVAPPAPAINNCIYNRTGIFPFLFEGRKRDKAKALVNWIPAEDLSLQFYAEGGKDKYSGPTEHGLREANLYMYSADASYRVSDAVSFTAYVTRGTSQYLAGHSTGYDGDVKDTSTSFGFSAKGKASDRLWLTADLTYLNDDLKYKQELDQNASAANIAFLAQTGGLPDVTYKLTRLKLTGDYLIDKRSSIKVALIYENTKYNEWTWQWNGYSFLYSDNTTLGAKENQSVTAVGATYTYRW